MYTFVITHQVVYCVYKVDLNKTDFLECKREWTRKGLKEWIWIDWEMSRWSGHGDKQFRQHFYKVWLWKRTKNVVVTNGGAMWFLSKETSWIMVQNTTV